MDANGTMVAGIIPVVRAVAKGVRVELILDDPVLSVYPTISYSVICLTYVWRRPEVGDRGSSQEWEDSDHPFREPAPSFFTLCERSLSLCIS